MSKRLPGESIAILMDDILQMVQRAYHNMDALAQEVLALNQPYKVNFTRDEMQVARPVLMLLMSLRGTSPSSALIKIKINLK